MWEVPLKTFGASVQRGQNGGEKPVLGRLFEVFFRQGIRPDFGLLGG